MSTDATQPDPLTLTASDLSLATDLYQLTMGAVYHRHATDRRGTFELFVRRLPEHRNFLIFAGLEQTLASLRELRFDANQIDYLRTLPQFQNVGSSYFERLAEFRFQGSVAAMPEGTVFFPYEPVLRVTGTLLEAQLVETVLLSIINFQTTIASKAARIRLAAGRNVSLAEFGGRRGHGPQAATWVARAAVVGGFDATSNVLAGQRLGLRVVGTMAHSFVLAFGSEAEAFRAYQEVFPEHSIFLVDTYDSLDGIRTAIDLGVPFAGVRLDSGKIPPLARQARDMLDDAGRSDAQVFVSGDMDEWSIARLLGGDAPIDAFGVGTLLATSADAPYLPGVYKLVEVELGGHVQPRRKHSAEKRSLAGAKQVMRVIRDGRLAEDRLVPAARTAASDETPLLETWMQEGELVRALPGIQEIRDYAGRQVAILPPRLRSLETADTGVELEIDPELVRMNRVSDPESAPKG